MKYWGLFRYTLDPKGRLVFPASWRESFEESDTLAMGVATNERIWVMPYEKWVEIREGTTFQLASGRMEKANIDKRNARVFIPSEFRGYAHLVSGTDLYWIGYGEFALILNEEKFCQYVGRGTPQDSLESACGLEKRGSMSGSAVQAYIRGMEPVTRL